MQNTLYVHDFEAFTQYVSEVVLVVGLPELQDRSKSKYKYLHLVNVGGSA